MEGEAKPQSTRPPPQVATITVATILKAMAAGLLDMQRAPLLSLSFGLLYAAFGWLILFLMIRMNYGSYTYPMATGFALVAPFAAGGFMKSPDGWRTTFRFPSVPSWPRSSARTGRPSASWRW
ncbi:MAG: hypothetical protein ABI705_11415 [Aestuariivirga sp.]